MERLFQTHEIRYTEDLEGIWEFQKLDGDFTGCEPCSEKMLVPSCWEMDPSCRGYRGRALYRKVIFTKRKSNLRLVFKGVSHTAEVYVNKKKVGGHYGAYTPFSILLPDAPEGRHEIELVVDNSFSEASALHKENDYYTYGGITRPVSLEYLNNVYIEKVFFTPRRCGNAWEAQIRVELHNLCGKPATLLCKGQLGRHISLDFGEVTVPAGRKVSFEKSFVLQDVKEWSPESPALYLLKMALFFMNENYPVDDWIDRVGFREIQVSGNRLLLNGRPIFLKGYNRHEDDPQFGCALPLAAQMRDLALMRETGANSVRTSHYPNDERFLDLCDSYGMLVWEEAHARGLSPEEMENPAFESQSRVCIQEMLENHYNHPSIVIWAVLNECSSWDERVRHHYESQIGQIRDFDRTRPVTYASNAHFSDRCLDLADIVSYNIYANWYDDQDAWEKLKSLQEWTRTHGGEGKPMVISEFGAGAVYGFRSMGREHWSEERQADSLQADLACYLQAPFLTGAFIWQFCDCRVTEGNWSSRPKTQNNKGVFDAYRRPKLSAEDVKKAFRQKDGSFQKIM